MKPERFVPAFLSKNRLLVKIVHEGRVMLRQAVQPATGLSSWEFKLLQRDFPIHGGAPVPRTMGPAPPPSAPPAGPPYAWMSDDGVRQTIRTLDTVSLIVAMWSGEVESGDHHLTLDNATVRYNTFTPSGVRGRLRSQPLTAHTPSDFVHD
jgi:hypothetical protein